MADQTTAPDAGGEAGTVAKDAPVRFLVVRFTGDERKVHRAFLRAIDDENAAEISLAKKQSREPDPVTLVDTHASGRDPQPQVPDESAKHAETLRTAGHHEAAAHLEHVSALHGRAQAELDRASHHMIQSMPGDVCVPGRPLDEHARIHHQEAVGARKHAANAVEYVWAIHRIKVLIDHRSETTKKEIRDLIATAEKKAAARAARVESVKKRDADLTSEGMKDAHARLAEWQAWKDSGLSIEEWQAKTMGTADAEPAPAVGAD